MKKVRFFCILDVCFNLNFFHELRINFNTLLNHNLYMHRIHTPFCAQYTHLVNDCLVLKSSNQQPIGIDCLFLMYNETLVNLPLSSLHPLPA